MMTDKNLYRITDLMIGGEKDRKLGIDSRDVVEVEKQDGNYSTFLVWLTPSQIQIAAEINVTYEKIVSQFHPY